MRPTMRLTTASTLTAVLLLSAAGCGDDDPKVDSEPTSTPSTSEPTPTADPSAWTKKYTKKQVAAYDAALKRWEAYENAAEPIWAAGKATPAAQRLFKRYYPSPLWQEKFQTLETYEQVEVKSKGTPDVLWSKPTRISKDGLSLGISQCVDWTTVTTTQRGKPGKPAAGRDHPMLREITLSKPDGYDWLIYQYETSPAKNGKDIPCDSDG